MKKDNILSTIAEEETETEDVAEKVIRIPELLPEVLAGIDSANPRIRFGSAKILRIISGKKPEILYSKMGFFVNLLDSKNNILKWNALDIIANLTLVDSRNEFSRLFKKFCGYLYEGNLITACHVVDNSGKIAVAKPELQDEITKELLKVERIPLPTSECRNILIGKTINAFQIYFNGIKDKDEVVSFVRRHLNNPRNATKTKAHKFLEKLEKQQQRRQKPQRKL
jgi:hypothetical protein